MNRKLVVVLATLLLTGCGVQGEVADEDKNKTVTCVDTRDGETFSFNTTSVKNIVKGFDGITTFDVTDSTGTVRKLNSNMEVFLKCKKE